MDDVLDACSILNKAGYECSPVSARGEEGKRNIYFTVRGSRKFFADIAAYVPESMRYKLPRDATAFQPDLWNLGAAILSFDRVIVDRRLNMSKQGRIPRTQRRNKITRRDAGQGTVYCIDVEDTHNFVTSGIVVHNCAVSRCINIAQTLLDQLVYKQEKLGSRPKRAIGVTSGGIGPQDVYDALVLADDDMNNQALRRYSKIPFVGSPDLTEAKLEIIDMVSLPDGFDWKSDTTLSMAVISLAFGLDARELFPGLEAGATRAEGLIAHIKQRGKGPGDILETTERLINAKFLPRHLQMVFDFQDDEQDRQRADIKNLRATRYVNLSVAGLLDPRTMREQMLDEGDLSQAQFERLELEEGRLVDGSDVLTLFANPELQDMLSLGVDNPTDLEVNEAAVMLAAIQDRQRMLTAQLSGANPGEAQRIRQALAALDRLKMLYGGRSAQASAPQAATQRRTEEGQALPGRATGIMPPFTSEDLELKMGTNGWRDRLLRNARKGKAIRQVVEALTGNGREPE